MLKLAVFVGLIAVVVGGIVGGFKKLTNLEDVQKLAQWSTTHPSVTGLLGFTDATVAQVVAYQLVNGLNYKIKFNVIGLNKDNQYTAKQCNLELYVSFADQRTVKNVNCADNLEFFGQQPYAGGQIIVEGPESYQLQTDLANWAINEHKIMTVNQFNAPEADLLQVKKFSKQVVSGMKYRLTFSVLAHRENNKYQSQDCYVEIWERPWLNLKTLETISCQDTDYIKPVPYANNDVVIGNERPEADYEKAQELASWAVGEYLKSSKNNQFGLQKVNLVGVPELTKKVVAGFIYKGKLVASAELAENKFQTKACDFEIWERAWLNPQRELISMSCQDEEIESAQPIGLPGSFQKMNDNTKALELAKWAVSQIEGTSIVGEYQLSILNVEPAETQVVAGINYRFKVDFLLQSNVKSPQNIRQTCIVGVYERSWENVRTLTQLECSETPQY